jgi:hypothetical protein
MIRRWTPGQCALRGAIVAGLMVALLATGLRGEWPSWWLVVLVGGLAAVFAVFPETPVGTTVTVLVLASWGFAFRGGPYPEALLAAAGLLTAHVAALVAGYGPGDMPVDPATVRRWTVRGLGVFAASPAVFVVALLLRDQPEPAGIWVAGLVAALVVTVAAGLVLARTAQDS